MGEVMHRINVNVDGTFDASPSGFLHPSPIGEWFRNELVSRDGGDGFIPVLHFHGGEIDFNHIAIGIAAGHDDPITNVYHSVGY